MLRILSGNAPPNYLFFFLYAVALKLYLFLSPPISPPVHLSVASNWLFNLFRDIAGERYFIYSLIAFLFLFFQAIGVNKLINTHKLTGSNSLLPGALYLLISSLFDEMSYLTPQLVAMSFLIPMYRVLLNIYNKERCDMQLFDIGLLVSLAAIFYPPYIVFGMFAGGVLWQLRSTNVRELVIMFSGFTVPLFLLLVILIQFDKFYLLSSDLAWFHFSRPLVTAELNVELILKFNITALLFISAFFFFESQYMGKVIRIRKMLNSFIVFFFVGLLSVFLLPRVGLSHFVAISLPLSVLFANFCMQGKSMVIPEVIHILYIAMIFFFQYINFAV